MIIGAALKVAKMAKSITIFERFLRKFAFSSFASKNVSANLLVSLRDLLYDGRRKMDEKELLYKFWSQKHPILNDAKDNISRCLHYYYFMFFMFFVCSITKEMISEISNWK